MISKLCWASKFKPCNVLRFNTLSTAKNWLGVPVLDPTSTVRSCTVHWWCWPLSGSETVTLPTNASGSFSRTEVALSLISDGASLTSRTANQYLYVQLLPAITLQLVHLLNVKTMTFKVCGQTLHNSKKSQSLMFWWTFFASFTEWSKNYHTNISYMRTSLNPQLLSKLAHKIATSRSVLICTQTKI